MVLQNAWVSIWGRLWDKPPGCRLLVNEHGAHGDHDSRFQGHSGPLGRPHGNKVLVAVHNCLQHDDVHGGVVEVGEVHSVLQQHGDEAHDGVVHNVLQRGEDDHDDLQNGGPHGELVEVHSVLPHDEVHDEVEGEVHSALQHDGGVGHGVHGDGAHVVVRSVLQHGDGAQDEVEGVEVHSALPHDGDLHEVSDFQQRLELESLEICQDVLQWAGDAQHGEPHVQVEGHNVLQLGDECDAQWLNDQRGHGVPPQELEWKAHSDGLGDEAHGEV